MRLKGRTNRLPVAGFSSHIPHIEFNRWEGHAALPKCIRGRREVVCMWEYLKQLVSVDLTGEDGLLTQKDGLNPGDVQFRVPGTRVFHPHPGCA